MFRENDIIVLLGAGCSVGAGIPASEPMLHKLHELLNRDQHEWRRNRELYCWLRAHVMHADALAGKFDERFHIERLVSALTELSTYKTNVLYPFVSKWSDGLEKAAGNGFEQVGIFRTQILQQLRNWVSLANYQNAAYYDHFFRFADEYSYALRVFSLNYDLCLEKRCPREKTVERGFDSDTRYWDWSRFARHEEEDQPNIYLYKLHGSLDWERDRNKGNVVREVDDIPAEPDLIFGTVHKMQYVDPYLFYSYEFRRYSLECTIIIVIGYSFADEHINGIIKQALEVSPTRKVLAVGPHFDEQWVMRQLGWPVEKRSQIVAVSSRAEDFLEELGIESLARRTGLGELADPFA